MESIFNRGEDTVAGKAYYPCTIRKVNTNDGGTITFDVQYDDGSGDKEQAVELRYMRRPIVVSGFVSLQFLPDGLIHALLLVYASLYTPLYGTAGRHMPSHALH